MQLELHLLDEKEELEEKMELPGGLTSGQEAALEKVNKGIGGIRPKLWQNGQQFVDLQSQWIEGRWTLERKAISFR